MSALSKRLHLATVAALSIGGGPAYVLAQQHSHSIPAPQSTQIQRIESNAAVIPLGNGEQKHLGLAALMKILGVPGVSVAVFDDFKILWAKGYGVTEVGGSTPVTTHTLFQAGDISQGVTAAATLALVQQGKLSLDADVNDHLR